MSPLGEITEEHFDTLFDINVKGTLFTVQKALPLLKDGGSIILTGSVAGVKGTPAFGVYGATKVALRSFARTWTSELKDRHIRSNIVKTGPIDTPAFDGLPAEALARIVATIPMGRVGESDEVARAALFLASDDSSFITGIELFVLEIKEEPKIGGGATARRKIIQRCSCDLVQARSMPTACRE